ncbi:unnamed protein product [Cuscuta europaea]|uniref:Uncharacterized protein n=1 Tax=Cuscuta europaea TaxID=41803 RepID=A0A9P0Z5W1_CUSEU|nr:unnamed protein product [Cuscuta europaea]
MEEEMVVGVDIMVEEVEEEDRAEVAVVVGHMMEVHEEEVGMVEEVVVAVGATAAAVKDQVEVVGTVEEVSNTEVDMVDTIHLERVEENRWRPRTSYIYTYISSYLDLHIPIVEC